VVDWNVYEKVYIFPIYSDEILNVFKNDPSFLENEEKYKAIKNELLGEESGSGSEDANSNSSGSSESESEDEEKELAAPIIDQTETNMIALRRTIYLTLQVGYRN
jgi:hypothetical protein